MSQNLGRIERPSASHYEGKRKVLLIPLPYESPDMPEEGVELLDRFWAQVRSQIASLERQLGQVQHIYHVAVTSSGDAGLQRVREVMPRSSSLVEAWWQAGAVVESTEDEEVFLEALDLQRCMMLPFASQKVSRKLEEWLVEATRRRWETVAQRIHESLDENEVGLAVLDERHQVQFPGDVEVIYVSPPALDEYHRWLVRWANSEPEEER